MESKIIAIYIQTIPKRKGESIVLQKLVKSSVDKHGVSIPIHTVEDTEMIGTFNGLRLCMEDALDKYGDKKGYILLCQDDITFPRNAVSNVQIVLDSAVKGREGTPFVNFFSFQKNVITENAAKGRFVMATQSCLSGQLNAYPICDMAEFLAETKAFYGVTDVIGDDARVKDFYRERNQDFYRVVPCPVQHLGAHRSSVGIGGFVGKMERVSDNYMPGFNYRSVDWVEQFQKPYIFNLPLKKRHRAMRNNVIGSEGYNA